MTPSKVYPSNIETACYYEMDWLDDDMNDDVDDDDDDDDYDVYMGNSNNKKKAYYDSDYKERYTAKLIDNYEENTSIDYDCHLFKRFEYIYEDIPREGIIFVNKPHSTDVWLPKAFREPIGLPLDMVPDIWKDLNPSVHPDVLKYMIVELPPDEEKHYQNTMKRWTHDTVETRREKLQEMEEKTKMGSILGLQEL